MLEACNKQAEQCKFRPNFQQHLERQQQLQQLQQYRQHYDKQISFENSLQNFDRDNSFDDKYPENTYSSINEIAAQMAELNNQQGQQFQQKQFPESHKLNTDLQQFSLSPQQQMKQTYTQMLQEPSQKTFQQYFQPQDATKATPQPLMKQQFQQKIQHFQQIPDENYLTKPKDK